MSQRPERPPYAEACALARGAVELRAVTRRYGRGAAALCGIDLTRPPGGAGRRASVGSGAGAGTVILGPL